MQKCWQLNPEERPSASGLIDLLIPRCIEEELDTSLSQGGCTQVEQVCVRVCMYMGCFCIFIYICKRVLSLQDDLQRYIEN